MSYYTDENIIIMDNTTALMYAAQNGHTDVIKLLLEAGASIKAKTTVSKRI